LLLHESTTPSCILFSCTSLNLDSCYHIEIDLFLYIINTHLQVLIQPIIVSNHISVTQGGQACLFY
jgi:hypothetical protein